MNLQTKQDFTALMNSVLNPLLPLFSQGKALLNVGDTGATYEKHVAEMEGFSRLLWALVPFWHGGGSHEAFEENMLRGIINGTNPLSCEYWGDCNDYDQRFVEMAAIATGILLAPQKLWHPLTQEEKTNLCNWLNKINEKFLPRCNWQFFMVLVNIAMESVDMPFNKKRLEEGLEEIESFYQTGGWYNDGASNQKDYYVPFALHYYGLIYAKVMQDKDPERSNTFKQRAAQFAQDFIYWFDENGAALPFGRSLAYRWAQNAFWSACLFANVEVFNLGIVKGIIVRNFEWWLQQKIFDRDGVLTIGYAYPNLIMAERYNAPGSPYWCMKSFLMLALDDAHPFWAAKPLPLPQLEKVKSIKNAEMIIQRFDNDVVALAAGVCEKYGHGHVPEKYSKFAYSTAFGFSCARSSLVVNEAAPDSMLAFIIDDMVFVRRASEEWHVGENEITSTWVPIKGITVKTTLTPTQNGHVRHHKIESEFQCEAIDYGFSVPRFTQSGFAVTESESTATARTNNLSCTVSALGFRGKGEVLIADPNTNVLFQNTAIAGVRYAIQKGETMLETLVEARVLRGV